MQRAMNNDVHAGQGAGGAAWRFEAFGGVWCVVGAKLDGKVSACVRVDGLGRARLHRAAARRCTPQHKVESVQVCRICCKDWL